MQFNLSKAEVKEILQDYLESAFDVELEEPSLFSDHKEEDTIFVIKTVKEPK
jgi:hypothetical protein